MGLFSAKPSVNAQKIIGWLGCECEYFPAGKPAQFISSTYEDAFAKKEMGGYTPVIIVVNDVLSEWFDMLREDPEPLRRSAAGNCSALSFRTRRNGSPKGFRK